MFKIKLSSKVQYKRGFIHSGMRMEYIKVNGYGNEEIHHVHIDRVSDVYDDGEKEFLDKYRGHWTEDFLLDKLNNGSCKIIES